MKRDKTKRLKRLKRISKYAAFARHITRHSVRDVLEDIHSEGRISENEMRELMLEVEFQISHELQIFEERKDNKEYVDSLKKAWFGEYGISWDNPKLDK